MFQTNIVPVELCSVVFEYIKSGGLKTLPVDRYRVIRPGDLICFECYENESGAIASEWVYAIAERIDDASFMLGKSGGAVMKIVKFRVLRTLEDIVIA